MIFTVTLNPAMDETAVIPGFAAGQVNRVQSLRRDVGGKGINVSKCLQLLGSGSKAAAFWGGACGKSGEEAVRRAGIGSLPVWIQGETRTNLKIVNPQQGQNTDINEPGPQIAPEEYEKLLAELDAQLKEGDLLVLAGSIPQGLPRNVYGSLIRRFRPRGIRVFLDADGDALRLSLEAQPYLIKPNIDELSRLTGKALRTPAEIQAAVQPLLKRGIREIAVSMGAQGAMFFSEEGCFLAESIPVPVRSTVGAGDSMVAALAFGCQSKLPAAERYRLAMAISAASVTCSGTQAPEAQLVAALRERAVLHAFV